MQTFGVDMQAAAAAKDYSRGHANPERVSAAHGRAASKIALRRAVERMRNGMALQLPSLQFLISIFFFVALTATADIKIGTVPLDTICLNGDAPDSVKLAATELQKFVEKTSGTKLLVTAKTDKANGVIYLGGHKELLEGVEREGFRIQARNGNLYITGHDSPSGAIFGIRNPWRRKEVYNEQLKLGAFGETGTLSGVYCFLEDFCGIRFYWPGDLGTVIPDRHDISIPENLSISKAPIFNCRFVWLCDFNEAPEDALWYRRVGFGGIAPVQIIDYNWFFTNKLKDSHPEIFALVDGERDFGSKCAVRGGGHLCYSHPNTVPLVASLINEYFDQHPEQTFFPMLPGDGLVRVCGCQQCQAEVNDNGDRSCKFSDHIWGFVNRVAAEVAKKHPDKFIGCSAYDSYAAPPLRIAKLHPNVAVQFGKNRSAMAAPAYEKFVHERIAQWNTKTDNNLCGWDFYLQCQIPWRGLPCLYSSVIKRNLKDMKAAGFVSEGIEAESWRKGEPHRITCPATQHLNLYLTGKLYWEPDLDLDAFFDEYCALFYGPAAKPMREFWRLCEERWLAAHKDASGFSIFEIVRPNDVFDMQTIDRLSSLLAEARKTAPADSLYSARLAQLDNEFSKGRETVVVMVRNKPPEITALKETEPFTIDGTLSEKSWSRGKGAFLVGYCGEATQVNTLFLCRNDGENLYVAFVLAEPQTDRLKTDGKARDFPKMYLDDSIEIYLMPHDALPNSGYQFIVNPLGMLWDAKLNENRTLDTKWDSGAVAAAKIDDKRWSVEISIPLSDINVAPGQKIKANFYRNRVLDKGGAKSSCWSPSMTEGHRTPSRFGTLTIEP